nr:hypothetical protein [Chroococcidiopsis sp. CCMEE 29]
MKNLPTSPVKKRNGGYSTKPTTSALVQDGKDALPNTALNCEVIALSGVKMLNKEDKRANIKKTKERIKRTNLELIPLASSASGHIVISFYANGDRFKLLNDTNINRR